MVAPHARSIGDVCADIGPVEGHLIRPWAVADAQQLVAAWNDPHIAKWNPVPPDPSMELAKSWIESTQTQDVASLGVDVVMLDSELAVDGSAPVLGEVGLQIDPAQSIGEVGFWLAQAHRGQGASKLLLEFASRLAIELELRGLVALVDAQNEAAIGLLTSAGWPEVPTKSERRAFAYRVTA